MFSNLDFTSNSSQRVSENKQDQTGSINSHLRSEPKETSGVAKKFVKGASFVAGSLVVLGVIGKAFIAAAALSALLSNPVGWGIIAGLAGAALAVALLSKGAGISDFMKGAVSGIFLPVTVAGVAGMGLVGGGGWIASKMAES